MSRQLLNSRSFFWSNGRATCPQVMGSVRQEIDVQREDTPHTGRPSVIRVDSTRCPARSKAGYGIPGRQRPIDARDAALAFPGPFASAPLLCGASRMCSCSLPCWSLLRFTDAAKHGADVHRVRIKGVHHSTTARHLPAFRSYAFTGHVFSWRRHVS